MTVEQTIHIHLAYDLFEKYLDSGYDYEDALNKAQRELESQFSKRSATDIINLMKSVLLD